MITLVVLLAVSWYSLKFTRHFYMQHTEANLESSALLLEKQVLRRLSPIDEKAIESLCNDAGAKTVTRITVILPDGRVVGDSEENPLSMDNHSNREEIKDAFKGTVGTSIRYSDTIKQRFIYVALPLMSERQPIGVLRTAIPLTAVDERIGSLRGRILIVSFWVGLLAALTDWYVSRKITAQTERMRDGARQFSGGNLSHRLPGAISVEFSELADSMNQMAQNL